MLRRLVANLLRTCWRVPNKSVTGWQLPRLRGNVCNGFWALLTTKLGPQEYCWQSRICSRWIGAMSGCTIISSETPQQRSTNCSWVPIDSAKFCSTGNASRSNQFRSSFMSTTVQDTNVHWSIQSSNGSQAVTHDPQTQKMAYASLCMSVAHDPSV